MKTFIDVGCHDFQILTTVTPIRVVTVVAVQTWSMITAVTVLLAGRGRTVNKV